MFEIWKPAVAIASSKKGTFKKGDVFQVLAMKKPFCSCHTLLLDLGFPSVGPIYSLSCKCGASIINTDGKKWITSKYFAPYDFADDVLNKLETEVEQKKEKQYANVSESNCPCG